MTEAPSHAESPTSVLFSRLKSLLTTPAAAGVLAVALLFDCMALPRGSGAGYFANIGERRPVLRLYLARATENGFVVTPTYDISVGAPHNAVGALSYSVRTRGFWALTRTEYIFNPHPGFGVLTEDELHRVRRALA